MIDKAAVAMAEDIVKEGITKRKSVSFSYDTKIIDVPAMTDAMVAILFYSTDEIASMKEQALMEQAGVIDSVSSEGQDLFQVDLALPGFRRKSLERVIRNDLSPVRSGSPRKRLEEPVASVIGATSPTDLEISTKLRAPRERGAPQRTRSNTARTRTDGRGPRGVVPRRARSSMVLVGNTSVLEAMQAVTITK
jgi:hypothetical protein